MEVSMGCQKLQVQHRIDANGFSGIKSDTAFAWTKSSRAMPLLSPVSTSLWLVLLS